MTHQHVVPAQQRHCQQVLAQGQTVGLQHRQRRGNQGLALEQAAKPDIHQAAIEQRQHVAGAHRRDVQTAKALGEPEGRRLPSAGAAQQGAAHPQLLRRLAHGREHINIVAGHVAVVTAVEVEVEQLAQGAVAAGTTALRQAEQVGHLHGAAVELEVIQNVEIGQNTLVKHAKT